MHGVIIDLPMTNPLNLTTAAERQAAAIADYLDTAAACRRQVSRLPFRSRDRRHLRPVGELRGWRAARSAALATFCGAYLRHRSHGPSLSSRTW